MSSLTHKMTVMFFLGVAMFLWVVAPISSAYQEARIIKKQKHPNEPARIIALKTKQGIIEVGEETVVKKILTNDDDWLKGLSLKVSNTSDKSINFVSVRLTFVRQKDDAASDEAPLMHSITYGRNPFHLKDLSLANQNKIPSGGFLDVSLSDDTYEVIKRVLKKLGYPASIKQIDLLVEVVGFDDGTVWEMGNLLRRDPKDAK